MHSPKLSIATTDAGFGLSALIVTIRRIVTSWNASCFTADILFHLPQFSFVTVLAAVQFSSSAHNTPEFWIWPANVLLQMCYKQGTTCDIL